MGRAEHPTSRLLRRAALALIGLAILLPALALGESKGEAKKTPGDAVRGKVVFLKNCMVCHNADGSGGKKLTPNGNASRDFRDAEFWEKRTDMQIRDVINGGVAKSGMIAWKGILKPSQIEDVMAYIKTFAKKPEAVKSELPEKK